MGWGSNLLKYHRLTYVEASLPFVHAVQAYHSAEGSV